jgi:hypothetical protein
MCTVICAVPFMCCCACGVCAGVRLLPPGEIPTAVRSSSSNNNNNNNNNNNK